MQNKASTRARRLIDELNQLANKIDMIDPNITEDELKIIRKVVTDKIDKLAHERGYYKTCRHEDWVKIFERIKKSVIDGKYDDKLQLPESEIFADIIQDLSIKNARSRKTESNT